MRLGELEFIRLLPAWMRDDVTDLLLAQGVEDAVNIPAAQLETMTVWDRLDEVPEAYLDELAWALNIDWYDFGADIGTKIELVKQSDRVHQLLGTCAAVEKVLAAYFREAKLYEWFEYSGLPHHFAVYVTDPAAVTRSLDTFLYLLELVKRKSSKFDGIKLGLKATGTANVGVATVVRSSETIVIGGEA